MKKILITLIAILTLIFAYTFNNIKNIYAAESTASVKGYNVENLTYLGDKTTQIYHINSSKGTHYGDIGMWTASYKFIANELDGTKTAYYVFFIESTICSVGKQDTYYFFRNKLLNINVNFYSSQPSALIDSTSPTTDSLITVSKTIGATVGTTNVATFQYNNTQTYSSITLTNTFGANDIYTQHTFGFSYLFTNWKDGAMVSPNIGKIDERIYIIYGIENYNGIDNFSISITTTGTIFKDATWPRENYTLSGSITHIATNGTF